MIIFAAGVTAGDKLAMVRGDDAMGEKAFVGRNENDVAGGNIFLWRHFDNIAIGNCGEHAAPAGAEADGISAIEKRAREGAEEARIGARFRAHSSPPEIR
jgi:hypothetical protein